MSVQRFKRLMYGFSIEVNKLSKKLDKWNYVSYQIPAYPPVGEEYKQYIPKGLEQDVLEEEYFIESYLENDEFSFWIALSSFQQFYAQENWFDIPYNPIDNRVSQLEKEYHAFVKLASDYFGDISYTDWSDFIYGNKPYLTVQVEDTYMLYVNVKNLKGAILRHSI